MEHLVYSHDPGKSRDTADAANAKILSTQWSKSDNLMPFQPPLTPWLGFDHDSAQASSILEYPKVRGWDPDMIWKGNLRNAHSSLGSLEPIKIASTAASMLQSWLFFGLLEALIDKKIEVSYMVRANEVGRPYVYTRNLHPCLQAWKFGMRMVEDAKKVGLHQKTIKILSYVHSWVERLNTWTDPEQVHFHKVLESNYPTFSDQMASILPSIVRLAEAIDSVHVSAMPPTTRLWSGLSWRHPLSARVARTQVLRSKGWCPFTIQMMWINLSESVLDWLTCGPARPDINDHLHCKDTECNWNNIDTSTYRPSHDSDSCNGYNDCLIVKPALEEILEILRMKNDCIPMIGIKENGSHLNLSVLCRLLGSHKSEPQDYIAISHVWVHGLGSTSDEGIWECQARRLLRLAQEVTGKVNPLIWMDSLCIPKVRDLRTKAIMLMRETYANASKVLVIDKTIRVQSSNATCEKIYCAIYASAWMQRLWTYQEACLAQELVFECADRKLYTLSFPSYFNSIGKVMVWRAIGAQMLRLRIDSNQRPNIGTTSRALNWRSTSRAVDEIAAVAGFMQLGRDTLREILDTKNQMERMIIFLRAVQWLPFNIPFLLGSRMTQAPWRWAPTTFMNRSSLGLDTDPASQSARVTDNGLEGKWLVLTFSHFLDGDRTTIRYAGSDMAITPRTKAFMFRFYCKQDWPEPPASRRFNAVIINHELDNHNYRTIDEGSMLQGLAVVKHAPYSKTQSQAIDNSKVITCGTVSQVLIEKMKLDEVLVTRASLMFAPPVEGITRAKLQEERLCIT